MKFSMLGLLHHGLIQPRFLSLAVAGNMPAVTSDCLEGATSGSTKKETCFNGSSKAQDKEVEGKDKPTDRFEMLKVCDKLIEVKSNLVMNVLKHKFLDLCS